MIEENIEKYIKYIGMNIKDVEFDKNVTCRVIRPTTIFTCDFIYKRLNFHCDKNDKIVKITRG
jgi:hypothetical protein